MSNDRRKEAVEILAAGKIGALLVGGFSLATSVYFPYRGIWIICGTLGYAAYEFYNVADNMQHLYKSKIAEIKARLSREEAIAMITTRTYVAKNLFQILAPEDFGAHLFPN